MSYSGSGWKKGGALEAFYGGYQTLGGYTGGAVGGAADLSERTGTGFHSAAKRALIKDFQHILLKLGMDEFKGVEDIDEVLRLMRKRVPDPRKGKGNGLSWGKDKQGQVAVCKTLAAAINDRAPGLINLKSSPDDLCRQISEVVYDLFGGLSAELLTSRNNLERAVKNLRSLKKFLDDNFKLIENKIAADKDSTLGSETSAARGLHHDLLEEVDRHLAKLQMMLDTVVQPSELELAELERDSEEFSTLVKKINKDFGTREAGRKISYTLTGFVTAVEAARIVDKALHKLGLSIKEYSDAKDFKDLKSLLSEQDLEALSKSEVDLEAYERAKQDLLKLHYLHDDVAEALKSKKGGLFNPIANGGLFNPIDGGDAEGGLFNPIADGGNVTGGLKLDKRVKRRQDLKRALIKDFNGRLAQLVNIILGSAKHVATALGDGKSEMTDAVSKFVKALESLPSLQNQYTYFCLTGATDDIRSREEREKFISSCKYIISTIDELLKENKSEHLKDMRDAFNRIIELIHGYVAKFAEGFGPLESWESYSKKVQGAEDGAAEGAGFMSFLGLSPEQKVQAKKVTSALKDTARGVGVAAAQIAADAVSAGIKQGLSKADVAGMGEDMVSGMGEGFESFIGGASEASYARVAAGLQDAVNSITYFHRIAVMRRGLSKASKEFKSYKDDYVKILADAVADKRDINADGKKAFVDKYEKDKLLHRAFTSNAAGVRITDAAALGKANVAFEKAKDFGLRMYDAADNMYKVAEAVDIYMKEFTDGISAHPDEVQNISAILDGTEIISKWFDDKSGDFVCQVFDSFPGYIGTNVPVYSGLNNSDAHKLKDAHYYLRATAVLNLGNDTNLFNQGHAGVFKWANAAAANAGNMQAWTRGPQPGIMGTNAGAAPAAQTNHWLPGNPYIATQSQFAADDEKNKYYSGVAALENAQKTLKQVSSLKNLVAAFVSIGDRFGGKDIMSKTNISAKLLLQYLNDYIAYSAFKLGFNNVNHVDLGESSYSLDIATLQDNTSTIDVNKHLHLGVYSNAVQSAAQNVLVTAAEAAAAAAPDNLQAALAGNGRSTAIVEQKTAVVMRGNELKINRPGGNINLLGDDDMFETTDKLFQLVIKSMTAKILTVIGTFNMFNRPINQNGLGYYSDLRLILGGAEYPTVIPESFELYIRLPLLAEFYRKVFKFEDDNMAINMIPEMDGTFSELIALIFDKARTVNDGNYSDTETRMLVEIINKIYGRFKNSKSPVRDCIEEFISEVNRRYGIVKAEERASYNKERRDRYSSKYDKEEEIVDYELEAIDEDDTFVRPSPSDGYRIAKPGAGVNAKHKYVMEKDHESMIIALRTRIDNAFKPVHDKIKDLDNQKFEGLRTLSFQNMINARGHELKHATSDKHRYEIVRNAIASLGTFAVSSLERSYLLFHDTVVGGLSALRLLYNQLKTYEEKVHTIWNSYDALARSVDDLKKTGFANIATHDYRAGAVNKFVNNVAVPAGAPAASALPYHAVAGAVATNIINAQRQGSQNAGLQLHIANGLPSVPANVIATAEHHAEALLRFGLKQEDMFRDLFEAIFNHAQAFNGLIEVKLDVSRANDKYEPAAGGALAKYTYGKRVLSIHVDYSKLREHIYSMLNGVKSSLDKFRGLLPKSVIDRYETYHGDGVEPSSVYDLEKRLIDELLEGKFASVSDADPVVRTLDVCNRKIKTLLDYFTRQWNVSGHMVVANSAAKEEYQDQIANPAGGAALVAAALRSFDTTMHQFTKSIYEIIYDPANAAPPGPVAWVNVGAGPEVTPHGDITDLLINTSSKQKQSTKSNVRWTGVSDNYLNCISVKPGQWVDSQKDMVLTFNKLMSAYLVQVYDGPSRSVYLPALNKFTAGSFSASIMGDKNYNDNAFRTFVKLNKGDTGSILFRSIAYMIRQLVLEKDVVGKELEFGKSDLAQIPMYVKERLRANLPVFAKLFTLLQNRSEMTKKFVAALNVEQQQNLYYPVGENRLNKDAEAALMNTLDQISYGCQSVMQCIQDVLQDLADSPKFFETHAEFISSYESMNGVGPFMPASSALAIMTDLKDWKFGMPVDYLGSDSFKLLYGMRGLMNMDKSSLADAPGLIAMIKEHNNTSDQRHHLSEKDVQSWWDNYTKIVQYIANARLYNQQLSLVSNAVPRLNLRTDLAGDDWVFQLKSNSRITDLPITLRLTESNFQREERGKVVKHVESGDISTAMVSGTRDELIAYNVVDLNIVPINLHALMREIPMVNLYNYAYTFDRLVEDVLGQKNVTEKQNFPGVLDVLRMQHVDNHADTLLAVLLERPYQAVDERTYESLVARIMRGGLGIEGLGRPKYLGDELYNKSLFGEIYTNATTSELEPDAASASARNSGALARNLNAIAKYLNDAIGGPIEAAAGVQPAAGVPGGARPIAIANQMSQVISRIVQYVQDNLIQRIPGADRKAHLIGNNYNRASFIDDLIAKVNGVLAGFIANSACTKANRAAVIAATPDVEDRLVEFNDNNAMQLARTYRNQADALNPSSDIYFLEKLNGKGTPKPVDIGAYKDFLKSWGKLRFDTRFVRNLFWIANIQRLLRLKLRRDLTWYNSKVVSDHAAIASGITELYDHDVAQTPDMYNYRY
jgi:hypothetical protein